jgi:serine/threonine-protein kinase
VLAALAAGLFLSLRPPTADTRRAAATPAPLAAAPAAAVPAAELPTTPPENIGTAALPSPDAMAAPPVQDKPQAAVAPPKARKVKAAPPAPVVAAEPTPTPGLVHIAISPWGQVEVNGASVGTTPPLTRLELPQGTHTITVRNEDFPAYTQSVQVDPERPVTLKHRFGS